MKTKNYSRLSDYEREMIFRWSSDDISCRIIGKRLHRTPSTITRELKRGIDAKGYYCADCAHTRARRKAQGRRKSKYKLTSHAPLYHYVMDKLTMLWSPVQIVERLQEEYPQDMRMRISHETIYRYLYVQPKKELRLLLRHGHIRRRKRGRPKKTATVGKIPDMTLIDQRPKDILSRRVPGHWEGDIIKGRYNKSALGTLVERTTRYTILVRLSSFRATTVRRAFARELLHLPQDIRKTLTYDQGKEMSEHLKLTLDTDMQVYFAHEGSPWERGTNENTNGLIRQFFPKGTDFTKVSRSKIKKVQALLNDRPRKVLGFKKPDEVLLEVLR